MAADGVMLTLYMGWIGFSRDSCPYDVISGGAVGPKGLRLTFFSEDGCAKGLSMVYHGHEIQCNRLFVPVIIKTIFYLQRGMHSEYLF